ncbi:MAG: hypothetical protein A2939_00390 [Parcubacteria group bacterium RIFCSPLOWO2_01_FULL_48_18]|nr:MAG: hypothetical protein A2939_00390 [Parcubacteria group bacterium RIFCSPLOWO2_01_FULL_48_18]
MVFSKSMGLIARFIIHVVSNVIAFLVTAYALKQFAVTNDLQELFILGAIFAAAQMTIRPLLKLLLAPFVVLTFGLLLIIINAITLYLTDLVTDSLTITGYTTLLIATIIVSVVNFIIASSARYAAK